MKLDYKSLLLIFILCSCTSSNHFDKLPDKPTSLKIINKTENSVTLKWVKTLKASSYKITNNWTIVGITEVDSFRVNNLINGITYTFKVRSVNKYGESLSEAILVEKFIVENKIPTTSAISTTAGQRRRQSKGGGEMGNILNCLDTNCANYTSQAAAQADYEANPFCRADLDQDKDGIACEEPGNSVKTCATTSNCGCSNINKSPCEKNPCCRWIVGTGCRCR